MNTYTQLLETIIHELGSKEMVMMANIAKAGPELVIEHWPEHNMSDGMVILKAEVMYSQNRGVVDVARWLSDTRNMDLRAAGAWLNEHCPSRRKALQNMGETK